MICEPVFNAQLLDCIIGSGSKEVLETVNQSLLDLGRKNMYELIQLNGIGQGKTLMIMVTIELSRRRNNEALKDFYYVTKSSEVFCLEHRPCGVDFCHNHPSGSVKPSSQDISLIKNFCEGSRNLDIYIGDHVIMGDRNYYRFAGDGMLF